MNRKTTWRLLFLAILLFAYISFFEKDRKSDSSIPAALFTELDPASIRQVEISRSNPATKSPFLIRLERQNEQWVFVNPPYPAQPTGVENLLRRISQAVSRAHITANELAAGDLKAFGLDPPEVAITFVAGTNRIRLEIGSRTPIANQVYVQVVGSPGIYLTDAQMLEHIPHSATEWRDPRLVNLSGVIFDHILIRTSNRAVEVERDRTNLLWRITKPMIARADSNSVNQLIRDIRDSRVSAFVKDGPTPDLEAFGLQPPDTEISFALDTNRLVSVQFGASPTNDPGHVYARLSPHTNIVLVEKEVVDRLRIPYRALQDTRLIAVPFNADRIDVHAVENFKLLRQSDHSWRVSEPSNYLADRELILNLMTNINELPILDFAKDVPSDVDLKAMHLLPPLRQYSFFTAVTNASNLPTNILAAQLDFGTNQADRVYARRRDEIPIYFTSVDSQFLPSRSWEFRDRRIWNFAASNVLSITIVEGTKTNLLARLNNGQWNADPIKNVAVEEAAFRLGQLRATAWVWRGADKLRTFGLAPPRRRLAVTLKGERNQTLTLDLGIEGPRDATIYCSTILVGDNEPAIFQIPARIFHDLVQEIPPPI